MHSERPDFEAPTKMSDQTNQERENVTDSQVETTDIREALATKESAEGIPDDFLLSWLFECAGISENSRVLGKIMILNEQGGLGTILQNPSVAERYFGSQEEIEKCKQLLNAVQQTVERTARASIEGVPIQENREAFAGYLHAAMAYRRTEQFRLLSLDEAGVLISDVVQHEGSVDHTPVYPREVVKVVLANNAASIVMAHNHPSNHPTPSQPDIDMTKNIQKSLGPFGVSVYDHFVVARKGHESLLEKDMLDANTEERQPLPQYPGLYSDLDAVNIQKKFKEKPEKGLLTAGRIMELSDQTPEMEAVVMQTLELFLTDEKAAKLVSDEVLLSWLLSRLNITITPKNSSSFARILLSQKGSLGALVQDPSSVHELNFSEKDTSAQEVLIMAEKLLMVMKEITERMMREQVDNLPVLDNWDKMIVYLRKKRMQDESLKPINPAEGFTAQRVLYLDRKNVLISDEFYEITPNSSDQQFIRQVTARSLDLNASAVMLIDDMDEQGASGKMSPQENKKMEGDGKLTKGLANALGGLGVVLHDRLAFNASGHRSFRQLGLLGGK